MTDRPRKMSAEDVARCPAHILHPHHYYEDGVCRCTGRRAPPKKTLGNHPRWILAKLEKGEHMELQEDGLTRIQEDDDWIVIKATTLRVLTERGHIKKKGRRWMLT